MSYDLFFRSRRTDHGFSLQNFLDYFKPRPRYEIKASQAWYSSKDSGVYFSFEYSEHSDDSADNVEADPNRFPVTFNLNYFRPHPFGLEAEPEVAAFVRELDLTVCDPQNSGMGEGEYSREGFLSGWNTGNAFAYRAIHSRNPAQKYLTQPSAKIESVWRWNFDREKRQNQIGDTVFCPRIFFFDQGGELRTAVVWADGIPILLPVVDLVLVPRQQLAPRRLFRSQNDVVMFAWSDLEPFARRFRNASGEFESYELFYNAIPADIEQLIRANKPPREMPKSVTFDQVLDSELLEQARNL